MTEPVARGTGTPTGTRMNGIVQIVDLEAAAHSWETSPGVVVHGHAFNGQVPGPTIEATAGDTLSVRFTNGLPEPAVIHWHGLPAEEAATEAAPLSGTAQPGSSLETLIALPGAGAFCYHIHPTAAIGQGLYGVLLVRHSEDPAPDGERCLIITATQSGHSGPADHEVLLVNGTSQPQLAAAAGQPERWRLFNLTGQELRLLLGNQRCVAVDSGGQYQDEGEADCPAVAPWGQLDVALGPLTAGETVRLEAAAHARDRGDRPPHCLATLHAAL
jgi:FtsP/CotA-like multicopper oxidase with cupredoxin domain